MLDGSRYNQCHVVRIAFSLPFVLWMCRSSRDASSYNDARAHQVYQPQWLGHELSLFPHVHSLKQIAECIEGALPLLEPYFPYVVLFPFQHVHRRWRECSLGTGVSGA